ncbi:HSF-type DNA-binding protein [Thraustotheca clavata]|uniref:HSF-type DNA-binding protein n=1 Tax=Thraustotheca clavata TaxID=74557 RepID=A0A1W0A3C0_9STRA|nr:HSF-type DNA-binding protein [Thraustotheca clavata]
MRSPPPTLVTRLKKRDVGVPKFLRSLYDMLDNENSNIISWTSDGVAVQVLDRHALETIVLPKYFKHSKFTSFQRQLNYFGFKKNTRYRSHMYTFTHPYFRHNRKDLLCKITRHYGPDDENHVSVEEDEAMEKFLEAETPTMEDVPFSVDPMLHLNEQDMEVLRELIEPENPTMSPPRVDNYHLLQSLTQFPGMEEAKKSSIQPPHLALDAALTDSIIHDLKKDQRWSINTVATANEELREDEFGILYEAASMFL